MLARITTDLFLVVQIINNTGSVILLENLRFHIEEEGKGLDSDGRKVQTVTFGFLCFIKN